MDQGPEKEKRVLVLRHGERCDFTFNHPLLPHWTKRAFDSSGRISYWKLGAPDDLRYHPFDINLPRVLPKRKDGQKAFAKDTPLTEMGYLQAKLTGRAIKDAGIHVDYIYSSSALRCVQTAVGICKALGTKKQINIEPGLFEWMAWCRTGRPTWMSPQEFHKLAYPVNAEYTPLFKDVELDISESLFDYYTRSHRVINTILRRRYEGTVLIIAHGASLETLTRQMTGQEPRSSDEFFSLLQHTPYLSCIEMKQDRDEGWTLTGSPILPLTHVNNDTMDANQFLWTAAQLKQRDEEEKVRHERR